MKIYNKYIVLAAMALTFAACTQEDDYTPQTDGDAVKINATIGKLQTRVAYEDNGTTNFINGDQIRVVNTMRTSKNSATYTFDGTTWTTTDAFVWNGSTTNQFKAWYPATASFDSFDLPTDQSAGIEAADWMTAETEEMTKPGSGVLNLNFVHKLTKVTVTVSFNSQYPAGNNYVSKFRFFTNEETPVEVTPHESMDGYTAILLPGVYAETAKFIKLKMNDETDYLTVPVNSTLTAGLEAGKHYNFHLTVGKDAVDISYVRVLDWDEEEIDGGVAEELIPTEYDATSNTYKVYQGEYLQTAFDDAEQTGTTENPATVKIMRDMEVTGIPNKHGNVEQDLLMDAGVIVLDLNGHTLKTANTGDYLIWMKNGATLTINDSSEEKCGKMITYDQAYAVIYAKNGKLVINGGTFEGTDIILGWDNSSTIEINGGTFIGTDYAIYSQSSILTITGGTFTAGKSALYFTSNGKPTITGGSFSGGEYDINTAKLTGFLSYNEETGEGPTFPGGLSISGTSNNLNALLVTGAGYYVNDELQTLAEDARSCEGDVTVKRIPATE